MQEAKSFYEQRQALFTQKEKELSSSSTRWSQIRLALFFTGALTAITAFWNLANPNYIWLIPSIASFFGLNFAVSRHLKVRRELAYAQTMLQINKEASARLERRWDSLPKREKTDLTPLSVDLNLFGHASLFHFLCRSGTHFGQEHLAHWIKSGIDPQQLKSRQTSVQELAQHPEWLQQLECLGRLSEGKEAAISALKSWCQKTIPPVSTLQNICSFILPLCFWGTLIGTILIGKYYSLIFVVMVINSFFSKSQNKAQQDQKLWAGESSIAPLGELFGFLAEHSFKNPELVNWQNHLEGNAAKHAMKDLAKWIHFQDVRRSELMHSIVQACFLWDIHIDRGMSSWHQRHGAKFNHWLDTLIQFDALISLSGLNYDHPNWCFMTITPGSSSLTTKNLGHALLPENQVVRNDLCISKDKPLLLVSGSNMAGKSTLLRALGVNIVLGQMGAPTSAEQLHSPKIAMGSSFRVNDSLADGVSYFMAELQQLKSVVNLSEQYQNDEQTQVLFLFDEILLGTNIHDRQIAVRQVTENLLNLGAWGAISTHDLSLSEVDNVVQRMVGVHFAETFHEEGENVSMKFDYKLKPGLAKTSNALYLVKMVGLSNNSNQD
jgi:hypothetical protein